MIWALLACATAVCEVDLDQDGFVSAAFDNVTVDD